MKLLSNLIISTLLLTTMTSTFAEVQECPANQRNTTPDSRFEDLNNGTVKDLQTDLIWQRCSIGQSWKNGQCLGEAKSLTWQQALTEAKSIGDGWRLPNIKELNSIAEYGCISPKINLNVFPVDNDEFRFVLYYWSSTPYKGAFNFGYLKDKKVVYNFDFINATVNRSDQQLSDDAPVYARAVKSAD